MLDLIRNLLNYNHAFCEVDILATNFFNKTVSENPQKYISIDRRYLYCIFTTHMTSICEKNISAEVRHIQISLMNFVILWKKNRHSWRLSDSRKAFLNQWESMGFRKLKSKNWHFKNTLLKNSDIGKFREFYKVKPSQISRNFQKQKFSLKQLYTLNELL